MECKVCDSPLFQWTDVSYVAQCRQCGAPHDVASDFSSCTLCAEPEIHETLREYWRTHKRPLPHAFNPVDPSRNIATVDDAEAFFRWMEARFPKTEEVA